MKRFLIIIASIIFLNAYSYAQISSFGLQGVKVTDLRIYGDTLYAATKDSGVYRRNLNDTGWVNIGLKGKFLLSIYPHPVDSQGYFLTVGAWSLPPPVIYSLSENGWFPENTGPDLYGVLALNGIESQGMTNMIFAGGGSSSLSLARRKNVLWEFYPDFSSNITEIKISRKNVIWIGGGGCCAFVGKSTDIGETWTPVEILWPVGGFCEDIEFDPFDPEIVYILTWDMQKSTDDGVSWQMLNTPRYSDGQLEIDPFYRDHIFVGSKNYGFFLYETTDEGISWDTIPAPLGAQGINDLEINLRDSIELYIATEGTGVYRLVQATNAISNVFSINEGWNMLSVPNRVHDFCKNTLLSSSISSAFTYENSYISKDTLQNGIGYWSKFNSSEVIRFIGEKITSDSIDVN